MDASDVGSGSRHKMSPEKMFLRIAKSKNVESASEVMRQADDKQLVWKTWGQSAVPCL